MCDKKMNKSAVIKIFLGAILKFAKIGISKKMTTKIVYMFWIVVTLARMFYVLPYYHG